MTEKEKIGRELREWLDKDPQYCMILIPYALQIGVITNEEAEICRADLERYYNITGATSDHRNKVFSAIIPELGFSACKILYNIVCQLPDRHAKDYALFPDDVKIRKQFDGMGSIQYYTYINGLVTDGYISKGKQDGRKTYIIHFDKMESVYEKSTKNIVNNNGIQ